jgi:hypothetical protein
MSHAMKEIYMRRRLLVTQITGLCLVLAGPAAAQSPATPASPIPEVDPATYCTESGGTVIERTATWNTNGDPSTWLPLANTLQLCEFEQGEGDDTTRLSVDLVTLSSTTPTLAAIAWLSPIEPTVPPEPGPNPAWYHCVNALDGTSAFGSSAAGGGWIAPEEPVFTIMDLCVFPDLSAIDAFGLLYHADGAVRGVDLTPLLRYQPGNELPAVFPAETGRH